MNRYNNQDSNKTWNHLVKKPKKKEDITKDENDNPKSPKKDELKTIIEHLFTYFLNQIGWNTSYNLNLKLENNLPHLIEANIDISNWTIEIKFGNNLLESYYKLLTTLKLTQYLEHDMELPQNVINNINREYIDRYKYPFFKELYNFISGISYHEVGHSEECPLDINSFTKILSVIYNVLISKGEENPRVLYYIINLFTDIIVNTIYGLRKENSFFRNTFFTFYLSELEFFNAEDKAFLIFILLNIKLFIFHIPQRDFLEKKILIRRPIEILDIVKKILKIFCPFNKIFEYIWNGLEPNENLKWKLANYLMNQDNWESMAIQFAEQIYPFVSIESLQQHNPIPDSIFIKKLKDKNQISFRKQVIDALIQNEQNKQNKMKLKEEEHAPEDQIAQKVKILNENEDTTIENIEEDFIEDSTLMPSTVLYNSIENKNNIKIFDNIEILDQLYLSRIKKITISYRDLSKNINKNVSVWLNRELITQDQQINNFDPFSVIFLPNSEDMLLYNKTIPLTNEFAGSTLEKGFPDLAIICDASGSMNWEPLQGKGKYDALIITIYSLFQWLKTSHFAPVIKYNFLFFSNKTKSTGWVDFFHLDEVKKLLFNPEGGGTRLNPKKLKDLLKNPKNKIIILITDGEIFNSEEILKILNKNRHTITFLLIQIGAHSNFSQKLKELGFNVTIIKNIDNLKIIVLDFLKKLYY